MDDSFQIPVTFKGKDELYTASLITYGYSYKIQVEIDAQKIFFEPDEEKSFRAIVDYESRTQTRDIDPLLLKAIAESLQRLLSNQ